MTIKQLLVSPLFWALVGKLPGGFDRQNVQVKRHFRFLLEHVSDFLDRSCGMPEITRHVHAEEITRIKVSSLAT